MQAGSITIPEDFVLLPAPETDNLSSQKTSEQLKARSFKAPDFVFLIQHVPTGDFFLYDLGMRKDLEGIPRYCYEVDLPFYDCDPVTPQEILQQSGPPGYHPTRLKAIILSHLHFDHVGDCGRQDPAYRHAELWMGHSACREARPGYPCDPDGTCLSDDFPRDRSRTIVEFTIPAAVLEGSGDGRIEAVEEWQRAGHYEGIERRTPKAGWKPLGSFRLAFDLFEDGSAYIIDSPGHSAGHQSLLVRVKTEAPDNAANGSEESSSRDNDTNADSDGEHFILLAGDSFHHPALLQNPGRSARAPYSAYTIHVDDDRAIDTMIRTREFAKRDNIWVVAAHDMSIVETLAPCRPNVEGLVPLNDWRQKGWKRFRV